MDSFAHLDAVGQAELCRSGQVAPRELVEAAVDALGRLGPRLGSAVVHERCAEAVAECARLPFPDAPFSGVPLLLKDFTLEVEGWPYTAGTRFLKRLGWRSPQSSALAERYRRAGFVLLGQTCSAELGGVLTTEPHAFGPTLNPWDTTRSAGGSSGGSAAVVAAGLVPVAHGSDGAGSIRIPASACGLVGLKPSRGRVPLGPQPGHDWGGIVTQHVLARSVRDAAAVLDATAGALPGDHCAAPRPQRPFASELAAEPERLRVGLLARPLDARVASDPECAAAAESAARALSELGHEVEPAWPAALADPEAPRRFGVGARVATARALARFEAWTGERVGPGDVEPFTAALAEAGRRVTAPDYAAALEQLERWGRSIAAWWEGGFDLLLTPTLPTPPWPLGHFDAAPSKPLSPLARIAAATCFTAPFNVSGQPAISLPLAWSASGLPLGIQLVAAPWREDLLLQVAGQLERARPWRERRPPLHAALSASRPRP